LQARLKSLGDNAGDDIDENYLALASHDRNYAMDIIRAVKESPFFFEVMSDRRLLDMSATCLNASTLLSVHDIAQFRIDPPNDDIRNFDWHQDFQYNVMSPNSVTVWYPLTPIASEMGPLIAAPNTHHEILPIEVDFDHHSPGTGTMHRVFKIKIDEAFAEQRGIALSPIQEGDVVFFHSLLLHRISANRSQRCRWTMNPRFGDALDPQFVGRGWRSARDRAQNIFAELYPDLVIERPAPTR
jgi:ectoine hydroxylase-related dioxygenase (phytanoyl-CoA dioxygenase family)